MILFLYTTKILIDKWKPYESISSWEICCCYWYMYLSFSSDPLWRAHCYWPILFSFNVCIWNKMLHISYIYYFYFHVCLSRYMFLYSCRFYRLACLLNDMITFTLFYQKFRYLSLNKSIWYLCQRKLILLNLNNLIILENLTVMIWHVFHMKHYYLGKFWV